VKSVPCLEISNILVTANDSTSSFESFDTTDDSNIEKTASVRQLIEKHMGYQKNVMNANVNNLGMKKKSFTAASKETIQSCNDGIKKKLDTVGNVVRLVFKFSNALLNTTFFQMNIRP